MLSSPCRSPLPALLLRFPPGPTWARQGGTGARLCLVAPRVGPWRADAVAAVPGTEPAWMARPGAGRGAPGAMAMDGTSCARCAASPDGMHIDRRLPSAAHPVCCVVCMPLAAPYRRLGV